MSPSPPVNIRTSRRWYGAPRISHLAHRPQDAPCAQTARRPRTSRGWYRLSWHRVSYAHGIHVVHLRVYGGKVIEEGGEVPEADVDVLGAAHLTDRVHAELGHAHVHCAHTHVGAQDGSDGGPTTHVISHHKLLRGDALHGRALAEERGGERCSGVTLVGVVLHHHSLVHPGRMVWLVLVHVVWVQCVRHVGAHEKTVAQCALHQALSAAAAAAAAIT
mmetsp:Transcript_12365/g.29971  ORF Transcript_12365/g.29971 Transcript_12365/m.29971 type:complete len:218 (-) Transcript_12365:376-1029(-)